VVNLPGARALVHPELDALARRKMRTMAPTGLNIGSSWVRSQHVVKQDRI
jgi:hypothetical protein